MITFSFDTTSGVPLYHQLYLFIKSEIKSCRLKPGEKLVSKRKLSSHLKISKNTIETAYEQLMAEGYIKSVPKSGYYVAKLDNKFEFSAVHSLPEIKAQAIKNPPQYKYDFKTNMVDTTFFPFATWSRISKEIMHDENRELLKASHPQGDYQLRQHIAKYLHEYRGVNCHPEQIIIGAGTEYLLGLIVQILGRQLVYGVENPGYSKTYRVLESNGANVLPISLDDDGINIDSLISSGVNVSYITPSHQFPLGIIMPIKRRMELLGWANEKRDRYIIEDDYDSEFRFNGRPIPALQGLDTNQKAIYMSTFSKSIAPSIRISYMVLPPLLLEKYQKQFMFYSSTVPRFEQYTLYKFISGGHFERHLNKMRNIYRSRKEHLVSQIKKLTISDNIEIIGENAGLHLLLKVNGMYEDKLIESAKKHGIKLYGLSDYYIAEDVNMPENVVMLGYSNFSKDEITNAIGILQKAWNVLVNI